MPVSELPELRLLCDPPNIRIFTVNLLSGAFRTLTCAKNGEEIHREQNHFDAWPQSAYQSVVRQCCRVGHSPLAITPVGYCFRFASCELCLWVPMVFNGVFNFCVIGSNSMRMNQCELSVQISGCMMMPHIIKKLIEEAPRQV